MDTMRNTMFTLGAAACGVIPTHTEKEHSLYTELRALSKRYPVIVNISGTRFEKAPLHSMIFDSLMVRDSVVTANRAHVMVTLSKARSSGQSNESPMFLIDKLEIIE
ncbi:MAG: hypothetical protein [Caudoviricetes sp.]|nr:MAG: hypothetical protein [Caudoviricetes sp.]